MKKMYVLVGAVFAVAMLFGTGCDFLKSEEEIIKESQTELFKKVNINATVKDVKKVDGKMQMTVEIAGKDYTYTMEDDGDGGYKLTMSDQWDIRNKVSEAAAK